MRAHTLLLAFPVLLATACGGGGGGPGAELSSEIVYSRHRDPVTAQIMPVLTESGGGFDAAEVDSPCVVVDPARPGGDRFLLFYEAADQGGAATIGLVTSGADDFAPLATGRTQAIARGGSGSGYDLGATDPTVVVDPGVPFGTDGRYKMWFEGRSGSGASTILFATSADGVAWNGFTACVGLDDASFASIRVADPSVLLENGTYKMWFEAIDRLLPSGNDGPGSIGYAESANGVDWTVMDATGATGAAAGPVFTPGTPGGFDGFSVNAPCVVLDTGVSVGQPGRYKLWYEAGDFSSDTQNTLGFAKSADGLSWSDPALPILAPSSDLFVPLPFDSGDLEHPAAVIDDGVPPGVEGHYLLWYTGDGENNATPNRIGLAKGRDGP